MPSARCGTGDPVTAPLAGSETAEDGPASTSVTVVRASTSR